SKVCSYLYSAPPYVSVQRIRYGLPRASSRLFVSGTTRFCIVPIHARFAEWLDEIVRWITFGSSRRRHPANAAVTGARRSNLTAERRVFTAEQSREPLYALAGAPCGARAA